MIFKRQATALPRNKDKIVIDKFLAAAIFASIPFGPVITVGVTGRGASISAAQILSLVLVVHLIFTKLASRGNRKTGLGIGFIFVALMAPPLFFAPDLAPAAVAYFNYVTGVIGGVTVGAIWAHTRLDRLGIIDAGLSLFLALGAFQLASGFLGASTLNSLHQNAQTPWGNSNYVAACLVVGSFVLLSRGLETASVSKVLIPILSALAAATLTLSRGAAVSMAIGIGVLLWTTGSKTWHKVILRITSILLPVMAINLVSRLESLRYQGSSHADSNIESRFLLFDAAWSAFTMSPLIGNGWISFRAVSASAVEEQSFAHNFFLSFLQIGGIGFGLITIVGYLALMARAMGRNPSVSPALYAALAISMSDPFFESTIANIVTVSAIFATLYRQQELLSGHHMPSTMGSAEAPYGRHKYRPKALAGVKGSANRRTERYSSRSRTSHSSMHLAESLQE